MIFFSAEDDDVQVVGEEVVNKDEGEIPTTDGSERETSSSGAGLTKDYLIQYSARYAHCTNNHQAQPSFLSKCILFVYF